MSLGSTTYASVTWTTGDIITETKLDNMVGNDQAYDSHAAQGILLNNNVGYYQKNSSGTNMEILNLDSSDIINVGHNSHVLNLKGSDIDMPNASIDSDFLNTGGTSALVGASQATSSTSFTDLATVGPSVTVTIGANGLCLVGLYSYLVNSGTNSTRMTFAMSGANTLAAGTAHALENFGTNGNKYAATHLLTGLNPGSTTFTAKYNVAGGTGTFIDRRIFAIPL